jgi:hypothetical protein
MHSSAEALKQTRNETNKKEINWYRLILDRDVLRTYHWSGILGFVVTSRHCLSASAETLLTARGHPKIRKHDQS